MKRLLDFFCSVKLTLALLLGLALVAVGGTIWPVQQDTVQRFDLYYQSLGFRLLLGLLALNLAACTWRTWARVAGERRRLATLLAGPAPESGVETGAGMDALCERLRTRGYRTQLVGDRVLARRGVSGRWALPVLHLAILAVMIGALAAQLGFVGTLTMYVNHQSDSYFDWSAQQDLPLGFSLRLDHFEPQYYPIDLRFATYDRQSRRQLQEFTTREGEVLTLAPGLDARVLRFYPEEQHLVLEIQRDGIPVGEYHALSGDRSYPNSIDLGVEIKPTAFRDPLLKQLHSEVSVLENGRVVRQGVIEVNHPLVHRGVAIYQTAYQLDDKGFWFCGFQLSKDPGEPLVWAGSIVLVLALVLVFTVRLRAVGVVPTSEGCRLVALAGFRGAEGMDRLAELAGAPRQGDS